MKPARPVPQVAHPDWFIVLILSRECHRQGMSPCCLQVLSRAGAAHVPLPPAAACCHGKGVRRINFRCAPWQRATGGEGELSSQACEDLSAPAISMFTVDAVDVVACHRFFSLFLISCLLEILTTTAPAFFAGFPSLFGWSAAAQVSFLLGVNPLFDFNPLCRLVLGHQLPCITIESETYGWPCILTLYLLW